MEAEKTPTPEKVVGSASCVRCRIANIYGPPSCFGDDCPDRLPEYPSLVERLAESIKDDRR